MYISNNYKKKNLNLNFKTSICQRQHKEQRKATPWEINSEDTQPHFLFMKC